MLESEQTEDKSWLYRRYDQLTEDKKHLLERADQLQSAHRASAIRSRQWSDLMLLLMVLGVVGSISLAVAHMFIAAPLILGISPAAYLAYWRLARASKDAGDMAHAERMRQVEYDGKQLELEAKRQEIAEKREAGQLELQRKRVELESKQLELAEKLRQ
ncbi:hypothetical protein SAMN04488580_10532 [Mycobacterium sp. 283mftsu]|nr:hypothetical protein SAMN04488580_10532 [Mycobacterium sp. 283mftsu]